MAYRTKQTVTEYDIILRKLEEGKHLPENDIADLINFYRVPENFEAFCSDIVKIKTKYAPDGAPLPGPKIVPFQFRRAQKVLWEEHILPRMNANKPVRAYILKARQIGFSTFIEALKYWLVSLHCNINALVCAHAKDKASEIHNMIKLIHKAAPKDFRPTQKRSNRNELYFANPRDDEGELGLESRIQVETADNKHVGAASTLQFLHLSEFARYESVNKDAQLMMTTLLQCVPLAHYTFVFLETTAYGQGYAKEKWEDPFSDYDKIFVSWLAEDGYTADEALPYDHLSPVSDSRYGDEQKLLDLIKGELKRWFPEYKKDNEWIKDQSLRRLKWRRYYIDNQCEGNKDLFRQEYPTYPEEAFLATGVCIFDSYRLHSLKEVARQITPQTYDYIKNIDAKNIGGLKPSSYGPIKIYKHPQKDKRYYGGVDIGGGVVNGDNSCLQLFDEDGIQVLTYADIIEPDEFAYVIRCIALIYNGAYICPEANSMGLSTINKLTKDLGYTNLYLRETIDKITQQIVESYGYYTTARNKYLLINDLRSAIKAQEILIKDLDTINELENFVISPSGSMGAIGVNKDDRVMALALANKALRPESLIKNNSALTRPKPHTVKWWLEQADNANKLEVDSDFDSYSGFVM